ncbi:Rieske (2Fe-2S) protein [Actinomadura barringtoniae]|uniref:Cytochrome bc1 complex Rieske iron-sulfur subunit n=1 Tax=Actinomadura barringtoniae TaxID=1427535 RepID=A0A939PCI1_9ACTN|nr:Rieske (2Fe-2S) protein [Actinomadura barringtoniae]MBO2450080.1 Rieske (2Fe-2S) protein [Actinomadura barringtoniae]
MTQEPAPQVEELEQSTAAPPNTRRGLLIGVGLAGVAGLAAACGGSGGDSGDSGDSGEKPAAGTGPAGSGAAPLARGSDIPVGGGKIFKAEKVVVTQPAAGTFKAFSAKCTHRGCTVGSVGGGTINCPCHGSKFKIEDGSVAGGPAPKPLEERQIKVENGEIKLA